MRVGTLERLGVPVRAITVEPVQGTLDAIEAAAQTDLVRVLTHEILNSLTPVTSLAGTAATLLAADPPDPDAARRAEGLRRFVDSHRAVARPPEPRRKLFEATPFAAELARSFTAEWPDRALVVDTAGDPLPDAGPNLLGRALINVLRNAAQATALGRRVRLAMTAAADGRHRGGG